jgi:hypothetical protein
MSIVSGGCGSLFLEGDAAHRTRIVADVDAVGRRDEAEIGAQMLPEQAHLGTISHPTHPGLATSHCSPDSTIPLPQTGRGSRSLR